MGPGGFGVLVGSFGPDGPGGSLIVVVFPALLFVTGGVLDEDKIEEGGVEGSDGGVAGDGSDEGVTGDGSEGARPTRFSNSLGCSDQN